MSQVQLSYCLTPGLTCQRKTLHVKQRSVSEHPELEGPDELKRLL